MIKFSLNLLLTFLALSSATSALARATPEEVAQLGGDIYTPVGAFKNPSIRFDCKKLVVSFRMGGDVNFQNWLSVLPNPHARQCFPTLGNICHHALRRRVPPPLTMWGISFGQGGAAPGSVILRDFFTTAILDERRVGAFVASAPLRATH